MTPIARSSLIAVTAGALFGATAPGVAFFGRGAGPSATATLLYAGAALGALAVRAAAREAAVPRRQMPRLVLVAALGAALAPTCLAFGLQTTGPLAASLLLNLEAIFTVVLAWVVFREHVGTRVVSAAGAMLVGGALLALRGHDTRGDALGVLAVTVATLAWALDNTLTRPLADLDPRAVVRWKASLGAVMSLGVALFGGQAWPRPLAAAGLVACGAVGYGASLRLYLRAQRALGAARTGSLFAVGPFVGAALSFVLGDRAGAPLVLGASVCFVVAVYLHLTERHGHRHTHAALTHEHSHRHDDGHHTHVHEPPVEGEHTHSRAHDAVEHDHPHAMDLHHRHEH